MKLLSKKLRIPAAPTVITALFSLRVIMPVLVPSLRFGVLKGLAFIIEKLTGHSVKSLVHNIALLAVEIVRGMSGKPRSLYTRGMSRTLTAVLGAVDSAMNDTVPYLLAFALPSAVIALSIWIYILTKKRGRANVSVLDLSRSLLLIRGVLTAFLLPVLLYGGAWLVGKSDKSVFAVYVCIAPVVTAAAAVHQLQLSRLLRAFVCRERGGEASLMPIYSAVLLIASGVIEMLPKLADIRYYGFEAFLAVIGGAAYICAGALLIHTKAKINGLPR